jgi:hypothetical protein
MKAGNLDGRGGKSPKGAKSPKGRKAKTGTADDVDGEQAVPKAISQSLPVSPSKFNVEGEMRGRIQISNYSY